MARKGAWFLKVFQCAKELHLAGGDRPFQCREKQSSEQTGQNAYWQEEARPAGYPSLRTRGGAAAGKDTMQVRMEMHVLSHVWSTAKKPICAPKCFGSAAMVVRVSAVERKRML